jgi:hypothetical protein
MVRGKLGRSPQAKSPLAEMFGCAYRTWRDGRRPIAFASISSKACGNEIDLICGETEKMEIAILIVVLIVIGSMIPAHHHIALLR